MTIYASIITYNPEYELLMKSISAVVEQVDKLIIFDNCSVNGFSENELLKHLTEDQKKKTDIIRNSKNIGIAEALNRIIDLCFRDNCEWLLTLDQDSVVPSNLIGCYRKYIDLNDVGQLCCAFVDNNQTDLEVEKMSPLTVPVSSDEKSDHYRVYACITSGSLINVNACMHVGGFNNALFIDYVDYDISLKLHNFGYSNYFIPSLKMHHEFGNALSKRFLWINYTDYGFSPARVYYKTRNAVYMMHYYPEFRSIFLKSVIYDLICIVLGFRMKCLGQFLKGLKDSRQII